MNAPVNEAADREALAEAKRIARHCVHCGFCLPACPTYTLLGDERDSPRGRIYFIKDMIEKGKEPGPVIATHIDRCLSCLSCQSACPSGVQYGLLVDYARARIESAQPRKLDARIWRMILSRLLPSRRLTALAFSLARRFLPLIALSGHLDRRLAAMASLVAKLFPSSSSMDLPGSVHPARLMANHSLERGRVALLPGCVQPVLAPEINEATIRVLNILGFRVIVPKQAGCCGALRLHMGMEARAQDDLRSMIRSFEQIEEENGPVEAFIVSSSGCAAALADAGEVLRHDPLWSGRAGCFAKKAMELSLFLRKVGLGEALATYPPLGFGEKPDLSYHAPCSLRHGLGEAGAMACLLEEAGYGTTEPEEAHLCCGAGGSYNLTQPELSENLMRRKLMHLGAVGGDIIAAGNIGCLVQLRREAVCPVVHPIELLNWRLGGPVPRAILHH